MKLNLGCGNLRLDGYKNIDRSPSAAFDELYDISQGIHELDESVSEINAGCVLEQFSPEYFMFVVNECWRVLEPGGSLVGYVPSIDPRVLHLDPMDKLFFQEDSFRYLASNEHAWKEFGKNYGFKGWSSYNAETNEHGIIFFKLVK